jgi:hypothetical protein
MRKKTVTVVWMDGVQEQIVTYGSVDLSKDGSILHVYSESYERDLPGGQARHIPLANVREYRIEV